MSFQIKDNVLNGVKSDLKKLLSFYDEVGLRKSNKQLSEDISGLFENNIEKLVEGAVAPKLDSEPDIRFHGEPIEIKTTNGHNWRGGTFSKRPGYYVFVSWEIVDGEPKFFVAGTPLLESDWKGGGENYYATHYGKKELVDNQRVTYFSGDLIVNQGKKRRTIKVEYS
jgi:hypothetical protein